MNYTINNIIASGSVEFEVDLAKMAFEQTDAVSYNPETFHGAKVDVDGRKIILFPSGSFIITGCKTVEDVEKRVKKLANICELYKV